MRPDSEGLRNKGLLSKGRRWTSHIKRRKWIHSSPASCSVQACSGLGAVLTSLGWWEQTFYNTSVDAAVNLCDTTLTDRPWNRILPPPSADTPNLTITVNLMENLFWKTPLGFEKKQQLQTKENSPMKSSHGQLNLESIGLTRFTRAIYCGFSRCLLNDNEGNTGSSVSQA